MQSTWRAVWQHRLQRHYLIEPAPRSKLLEVVGDVCGIHAQVAASAELSVGLRVRGITRQDVRDALWRDRSLVKTYGLRGTLHLFASDELPFWLAALRARTPPKTQNSAAVEALPPSRRDAVIEAIVEALDGRALWREELAVELERRVGEWATEPVFQAFGGHWPRWQLALGHAASHGLIAFWTESGQSGELRPLGPVARQAP